MLNDKLSRSIDSLLRHIDRDPERFEREFSEVANSYRTSKKARAGAHGNQVSTEIYARRVKLAVTTEG